MARVRDSIFHFLNSNKTSNNSDAFLENGSLLLEELLTFSNGRYDNPIRRFSMEELSEATNGFNSNQIVTGNPLSKIYEGSLEERLVLIKKYDKINSRWESSMVKFHSIRDLAMLALMSSHKNALKLLGCCLDFEFPALVCEHPGSTKVLSDYLYRTERGMACRGSLTWKRRVKIANEIANVVIYMHTMFPTPIIHRVISPCSVILDQFGTAKLLEFSNSISLPPGETHLSLDLVIGIFGRIDPEYYAGGILTEKADVYGFGVFILDLLTGKRPSEIERGDDQILEACVKEYLEEEKLNELLDQRIVEEGGGIGQQTQALTRLALRCIQYEKEDRPEMIDVGRELRRIQRSALDQP
ncbi:Non-specific serine/threonine protein kinase [Bertholletia excelsa]